MRKLITLMIVLLQTAPAFAGAWTQSPGALLRIEKISASLGGNEGVTVERYLEYGVMDGVTLITTATIAPDPVNELGEAGRGSVSVSLRQQIFAYEGFVLAAQSGLYLPRNFQGEGFGDAEFEHRAALGWGGSILGTPVFANVEAGVRTNAQGLVEARLYDFSLGQNLSANVQLIASWSITERFGYDPSERREQVSLVWSLTDEVAIEAGMARTLMDSPFEGADEEGLAFHLAIWQRR